MAGFWRRVGRAFGMPSATFDTAPRPVDQLILEMSGRGSAPRVGRTEALSVPAVQRGRNLICSIATLPLVQHDPAGRTERHPMLEQIDPDVPNVVTIAQTLEDLLFEGISWWQVLGFGWDGYPVAARHLDASIVSTEPPKDRSPSPLPSGIDPREGVVWVEGKPVGGSEIIRFDSPNPALLKVAGRAVSRAILLDQAARMYADDPRPLDYFTPADGADPADDDDVQDLLEKWKTARRKRGTAYVPAALKYNSVDAPSPADLQLVELQKQAALDIANALGVDPEELGISTTSRTYANAVDRRRDRINDVLSPFMRAITDRLSMGDVTRRGYTVAFDLDDYLRADPKTRWEVYKTARELGVITNDEIRTEEKMGPMPAGAPVKPKQPQPDRGTVDAVDASSDRVRLLLDDTQTLQADVPVESFSVDRERRVIEGLALPYGATAHKAGLKIRFARGALKWHSVRRVKLLRDHDYTKLIGVATDLTETSSGLRVKFKVVPGDAGDEALRLAEFGALDGLSVGVDFLADDIAPDPRDDSAMLVRRADLREVSLTPMPAFDDARVSKVTASRHTNDQREADEMADDAKVTETSVTDDKQGESPKMALSEDQMKVLLSRPGALQSLVAMQQPKPDKAESNGGLHLSAEQVDGLIKSGGLATLLGLPQVTPAPRQLEEPERRQTVNPVRTVTASASVNESVPYRFDRKGNLTSGPDYDFSTDLFNGSRGDGEALERAQKFMRGQFDNLMRAEFVTQTDAGALNPNRQRPDMYVDQQEYRYPIWSAINKGTLGDATPFVVPKFNSASGLVADHTEGTEPTPGTFTATSQTITPSAVSGKVEVTREAWEQGGNPQLSGIIWRQMTRAWFEALEAASVSMLDALTPTQITFSAAALADSALVDELTAALAALQYARGGFRMRDFMLQIDLYKSLIAAKDSSGRKLLPVLEPRNADGSTEPFFGAVLVGGLRGVPAWALAASGIVPASSYLFDRDDVHGWASAPQRLQFEYRVAYVDVAIWGYKALACTDVTGVREVVYDPSAA